VRPDGFAAIHIESVPPSAGIHHVLNHHNIDFAFGFNHFENFLAKHHFKLTDIRR
jgi:hypothetical protein